MTPAERARLIEQREFKAECEAIRRRAMLALEQRRRDDEARIAAWLGREPAPLPLRRDPMPGRPAKVYTHNGQSKTLTQWATETGMPLPTLRRRLRSGMSFERAITRKPGKQAALYTVNGVSKTLQEWADHIGITYFALIKRLHRHSLAEAVAMGGNYTRPGVPSDFPPVEGTGAGSTAQETPEIDFSEKAETQ